MMKRASWTVRIGVVCSLGLAAPFAQSAALLDLESVPTGTVLSSGVGLFKHVDKVQNQPNPTAFLTTQHDHGSLSGLVDAFNGAQADTGNPDADFNGNKTTLIQVSNLHTTTDGAYYVFLFDGNQDQSEGDDHVDYSALKVYTSTSGTLKAIADLGSATLLYDLDAAQDTTLRVDGRVGTGGADMYFFLPTSLNWGASTNYIYLYGAYSNFNDGAEHWQLAPGQYTNPVPVPMPLPGSLALTLAGLAGAAAAGGQRRRQSAATPA